MVRTVITGNGTLASSLSDGPVNGTPTNSQVDRDGDTYTWSPNLRYPGWDCDDNDPNTYPGAPEVLDLKDNDCDGQLGEGLNLSTFTLFANLTDKLPTWVWSDRISRTMLKVSPLPETGYQVQAMTMARTAFGRPLFTVECYVVDGWLIDCGPPATSGEIVRLARERRLLGVANTHQHEDHAGGDAALHRVLGLTPRAPRLTLPILAAPPRLEFYRWLVWGQPAPVRAEPLDDGLETEHHCFRVVPTPGHCPDHVCLLEPKEGWLFSGDLYISDRSKYLRAGEDAPLTLDSLRRVLTLDFDTLFCSHAGIVTDGKAALRRKVDYWENVQGRARDLLQAGQPLKAIRDQVLGTEGWMTTFTRGHFSKLNLLRSLVSESATDVGYS